MASARRGRSRGKATPPSTPPLGNGEDQLRRRIAELEEENERLRRENTDLREKLEAAERAAQRQAAPFRRPESKKARRPKRPGRPKGHPGAYRPRPLKVDEQVDAPLVGCPCCGGVVTEIVPIEQFVEDIPQLKPHVTRIVTYAGRCAQCGPVQSMHPRQVTRATGAAGTHLGPRAAALAVDLNKRIGIPAQKTCAILKEHFDLKLTPGGLVQLEARLAGRLQPTYQELAALVRASAVVHADETSWWVGGPGYWLWVFTNRDFVFYVVDKSRGRDVVNDVLGEAFAGVLVSDCLAAYEKLSCRQHKCYAHHLRAIADAKKDHPNSDFLAKAEMLLKSAIAVSSLRATLPASSYLEMVAKLETWADEVLAPDTLTDHEKIANRLRKRRTHLFTFLHQDGVDATNNAAERALRPAVVARKISCGNRTDRGRRTWQILASIAATCAQQRRSFTVMLAASMPLGASVPSLQPRSPP